MYTRETVIAVRPFTRQREGEDVIIGCTETGGFLAVDPEAVELLEQLGQGSSVGEVSDRYQATYGEAPDLDHFLSLLETKGFIEPQVEDDGASTLRQRPRPRYHFCNFPQALAQRLFSRPVLACCLLLIALALGAVIRYPTLMPVAHDLYFPDRRALSWTILMATAYATVFVHELAHLIAARAVGINSRMGISNRLWYVVAETDLTGLWAVPKRQRYMPMLAGMLTDTVSAALLVLLLLAAQQEWLAFPSLCVRLLRAVSFTYLMRIMWQFFFFVRTDLYYVVAALFNCRNLLGDTEDFLRNQLARAIPSIRPVDQSGIPASERRMIRAYAVLWAAGRIWAPSLLWLITVPLSLTYLRNLVGVFRVGYSANPSDFIDAVVLANYFLVPLSLIHI